MSNVTMIVGQNASHVARPLAAVTGISDRARLEAERRMVGQPRPQEPMPRPMAAAADGLPRAA